MRHAFLCLICPKIPCYNVPDLYAQPIHTDYKLIDLNNKSTIIYKSFDSACLRANPSL